jgi:large subunit ribosomal protein L24
MKIHKGDQVEIIAGKDKGKRGKVLSVLPAVERVLVSGANIVKRHRKARREGEKGERVEMEASIHISNVMLLCPETNKPTRVGYRVEGGEKVRFAKRSGKIIA